MKKFIEKSLKRFKTTQITKESYVLHSCIIKTFVNFKLSKLYPFHS